MPEMTGRDVVIQGAAEVKEKLKSDLSHWARVRRFASLKPMMGCVTCDATGRIPCSSCEGTGHTKFIVGDKPEACATCLGKGTVTCAECMGRGELPNVHRKKVLWLLAIGCLAWAFVLYRLWGGDVAPEMINGRGGGGRATKPANPMGAVAPGRAPENPAGARGVVTPNPNMGMGYRPGVLNPGGNAAQEIQRPIQR